MTEEDVIVKMEDMRSLRYCSRGIREFFERHNLDYSDFLQHGIPGKELLSASGNDAMAAAAVEVAHGREQ